MEYRSKINYKSNELIKNDFIDNRAFCRWPAPLFGGRLCSQLEVKFIKYPHTKVLDKKNLNRSIQVKFDKIKRVYFSSGERRSKRVKTHSIQVDLLEIENR